MDASRRSLLLVFTLALAMASPFAVAQVVTATVPAGIYPASAAVNSTTNKVYVANDCGSDPNCQGASGTVTVIDGATLATQTVTVGSYPYGVAVNATTNKIYVASCGTDPSCSTAGAVTVIDGATLTTQNVTVGINPDWVAVNPVTNKIYAVNLNCNSLPCNVQGTVTVIDGVTLATQTVNVGYTPYDAVVDSVTNKVYVTNVCGSTGNCGANGTVTVIDGLTLATQSVTTEIAPYELAVNESTNKIFVVDNCGPDPQCQSLGAVTVIDGATLTTQTVTTAYLPQPVAANPVTNEIYVGNNCGADRTCTSNPSVTVINGGTLATSTFTVCGAANYPADVKVNSVTNQVFMPCGGRSSQGTLGLSTTVLNGVTNGTTPVAVGDYPGAAAVNSATNTTYVTNLGDNTVSVIGGNTTLQFVAVPPCRLLDTRTSQGGSGPIQGGTFQTFNLPQLAHQSQGCPTLDLSTAAAFSLNPAVVPPGPLGYLTIWPASQFQPLVATMNSLDGRVKANAAIVQAGVSSSISIFASNTTDVVLDIDGYFAPDSQSTLAFYALPPCRVADTRDPNQPSGLGPPFMPGGQARAFPLLESSCFQGIGSPAAYSFNFTAVPHVPLGYMTVWPTGQTQPLVSTLNAPTGTVTANAALVPAGTAGDINVFPSNDTDLVIDVNGYFAAPGGKNALSLYPIAPCRVLDTRNANGAFVGELTVDVVDSVCAPPSTAGAYVFNATVVPSGPLGYLTLWPDGTTQPLVATLNALDGAVTSNMAIVPTNNGSIDAYASNLTQLILDISSYFAP